MVNYGHCFHDLIWAPERTAQSPPPVTTKLGEARTQVTPCLAAAAPVKLLEL